MQVPAITPDQQGRHGVKFETFFTCAEGATPEWLLRKGLDSQRSDLPFHTPLPHAPSLPQRPFPRRRFHR